MYIDTYMVPFVIITKYQGILESQGRADFKTRVTSETSPN